MSDEITRPELNDPTNSPETFDPLGPEFLSILPDCIRAAALEVPHELLHLTESELQMRCYPPASKRHKNLFETDTRLRALFWLEHQRASQSKSKMILKNVYQDVIMPANFINSFLKNPQRVAWMLLPFGSHIANVAALLKTGTARIQEILALPLVRQICRCHWGCICKKYITKTRAGACACDPVCICPPITDVKVGELIIRIYEKLELRAKGAVPQQINQRINSMNLNLNKNLDEEDFALSSKSIEEIDAEIARIESQIQAPQALPPCRDVVEVVSHEILSPTDSLSRDIDIEPEKLDNE